MNTTTTPTLVELIPLPQGTKIRYTLTLPEGTVTVTGYKGEAINPGYNAGWQILDDDGDVIALISRYARVEVVR